MVMEVAANEKHRDAAREQARSMGYAGSMMSGGRDAHTSLAEIIAHELIGGEMVRSYDFDIAAPCGAKVDVKNKLLGRKPRGFYEVSIFEYTKKQACDYLLFTATPRDGACVWICGGYGKQDFMRDAELKRAGTLTGSNRLRLKRDNYIMCIDDLHAPCGALEWLSGASHKKAPPIF